MRLFVIAGHSKEEPGALAYNGVYENVYTQMVQRHLAREHTIQQLEGSVVLDHNSLRLGEIIRYVNANAQKGDYGLDIHFNHNEPRASGTEVFICPQNSTQTNRQIASHLVRGWSNIIGIPVRRHIHQRDYKYPMDIGRTFGILKYTEIPFILAEFCFLNDRDLPKFLDRIRQISIFTMHTYKSRFKTM